MSLDLTIYPVEEDYFLFRNQEKHRNARILLPGTRLEFDSDDELFAMFGKRMDENPVVPIYPLPKGMRMKAERLSSKDNYGDTITYVFAGDLKKAIWPKKTTQNNRAIKAYIKALPNNTHIFLYWH